MPDSVGSDAIIAGAVGTTEIADNAITSAKIATDAVGSDEIAAGAVGSSEIGTGAVGSDELADDAVDTAAIQNDAVTFAKIDESTFPTTSEGSVATAQGTTSTTFTDLATVGPDVTMTPPASGKVKVTISALVQGSGTNGQLMGFALSSGNTVAASDSDSIGSNQVAGIRLGSTFLLTGLAASSTLFRAKYRSGNAANTGTFTDRKIIVEPVLA